MTGKPTPQKRRTRRPRTTLSHRELQVLTLTAKGLHKAGVGIRLGLTVHGVDWHTRQIMMKLRARNTVNAVFKAYKAGLLN